MKYSDLIKKANYFYKISVPIDEIVQPPTYIQSNPAPDTVKIKEFFDRTEHNYRLIYCSWYHGILMKPIGVEDAKSIMADNIIRYKQRVKDATASMDYKTAEKFKIRIEESEYLLKNGFNEDAINVIVRPMLGDFENVESIVHDICHNRIEDKIGNIYASMADEISNNNFISKIIKDYRLIKVSDNSVLDWSNVIHERGVVVEIMRSLIESSIFFKGVPGVDNFISYKNMLENNMQDSTPDFLPLYFKEGSTFDNVNAVGVKVYFNTTKAMGLTALPSLSNVGLYGETMEFAIEPINEDGSIPHVQQYMKQNFFKKIEKIIKNSLDEMVGKVFSLWGASSERGRD